MNVSSAMIIESSNTNLKMIAENLNRLASGEYPPNVVDRINEHLERLTEIVACLAIARRGITRRNPSFDMHEVERMVGALTKAVSVLTSDDTVDLVERTGAKDTSAELIIQK